MEMNIEFTGKSASDLVSGVMPQIESHLQMVWAQSEWIDSGALERVDMPLQGFVAPMLDAEEQVSAGDVVRALRDGLESYFERSIATGDLADDAIMRPIVERFGGALVELADAASERSQASSEELVSKAYDGIDRVVDRFANAPQDVTKELAHELHSFVTDAVEHADDPSVVRTYLRDRFFNLRESLRTTSQGAGGAIAALDELMNDPILKS